MPRKQKWEFPDGVVVTRAHVRLWMQTVGQHIPERNWHRYIRDWDVPAKVAQHMRAGTWLATIESQPHHAVYRPRAMRKPGTLARLRSTWPHAANDGSGDLDHSRRAHIKCARPRRPVEADAHFEEAL